MVIAKLLLILMLLIPTAGSAHGSSPTWPPSWVIAEYEQVLDAVSDGEIVVWAQSDTDFRNTTLMAYSLERDQQWQIRSYDSPVMTSEMSMDRGLVVWQEGRDYGTIVAYDARSFGYVLFNAPRPDGGPPRQQPGMAASSGSKKTSRRTHAS